MESTTRSPEKPQRKGHEFVNPWPGIITHGFTDFLKWTRERRRTLQRRQPDVYAPVAASPSFTVPRADAGSLTATWIGHTTVLLQIGGLNILTDPMWSERASPFSFAGPKRLAPPAVAFDDLPVIDAIIISHNHYDHLDAATVDRLRARFPAAVWCVPLGVADWIRARGAENVIERGWHDSAHFGTLRLVCVPAQHFSGRGLFDRNKTLWCGWVISSDSHSVYFAGDTALNPAFADIGARYGPFDLALMPIGAYDPRWFMRSVHLDPEECVIAFQRLTTCSGEIPLLLATHWGTFKLTDEPTAEPPDRMRKAWSSASLPDDKLWIAHFGETRVL